ncbi:RrF2 family transcriptional regulator [Pontibacter arcticus]|uniref:Transcriptional regulator n=1 Tax=Pontibacter arcticus TaxID=2080288 RepID=A0A364REV8_9BACT|nr:Rrf2 family transcriptional regulator [Pontibacter arcticus]RAU82829.1 transcriptional regulator [Pontibacter arcticus]
MILSKTTEYALRAVVYIALAAAAQHKAGIKQIAAELDLPVHFIGKILQDLVRKNIIASSKGPGGGFYMQRNAHEITILEIVRSIDGVELFRRCGMGMQHCSDTHPCPLHDDFKVIRDKLLHVLSSRTVGNLVESINTGTASIINIHKV